MPSIMKRVLIYALIFSLVLPASMAVRPKKAQASITVAVVAGWMLKGALIGAATGTFNYLRDVQTGKKTFDVDEMCVAVNVSAVRGALTGPISGLIPIHEIGITSIAEILGVIIDTNKFGPKRLDDYISELIGPIYEPICLELIGCNLLGPLGPLCAITSIYLKRDELKAGFDEIVGEMIANDLLEIPANQEDTQLVTAIGISLQNSANEFQGTIAPQESLSLNSIYLIDPDQGDFASISHITIEYLIERDGQMEMFDGSGILADIPNGLDDFQSRRVVTGSELLEYAGLPAGTSSTVRLGMRVTAWDSQNSIIHQDIYGDTDEEKSEVYITGEPSFDTQTVTPSSPSIGDSISFQARYYHSDNTPVDAGSAKVVVDGTQYAMSGDTASGSMLSSNSMQLAAGEHSYYFRGTCGGLEFYSPSTAPNQKFSLDVANSDADRVVARAEPASLTVCGSESSTITATATNNGQPLPNKNVTFVKLSGSGYLSSSTATTNSQGIASVSFTPEATGTTEIGAIINGIPIGTTSVVVSNCEVMIIPSMYMKSCSETSTYYAIDADITSNGNAVQNQPVTITCRDLSGNLVGTLSDYEEHSGNPLVTYTDYRGDVDAFLATSQAADVRITIECQGGTKILQNHIYGECVAPSQITNFTRIPFSPSGAEDGPDKIAVSPDGRYLAGVHQNSIRIYDISQWKATGQWSVLATLTQPNGPEEEALSVAWSPNGMYLAGGFDDPDDSDDPGLVIWNTGDSPSDFTVLRTMMTSENYQSVKTLCWSPDSRYVMTGEAVRTSNTSGGVARVWSLSGANVWTSSAWTDDVNAVAWSKRGYKAVGLDADDGVSYVWMYTPGNSRITIQTYSNEDVTSLEWNPDGTKLAVGITNAGIHAPIYVYNTSGTQVGSFSEHNAPVFAASWHPTNGKVATASANGDGIKIWGQSGTLLNTFGSGYYRDVAWASDGTVLLAMTGNVDVYALNDSSGPGITVNSPSNNLETTESSVTVSGTIKDPHLVSLANLSTNGGAAITLSLDTNGYFSTVVPLQEGNNTLAFTATDGLGIESTLSMSLTRTALSPDFTLSPAPVSRTVGAGESASYRLDVIAEDGFNQQVTLGTPVLPLDIGVSIPIKTVTPTSSMTVILTPSADCPPGSYSVRLSCSGGEKTHATTLFLVVFETRDNDGDGVPDSADTDDDNDSMPDSWELANGLNPFEDDADGNPDGDNATNLQEYQQGTDPHVKDGTINIMPANMLLLSESSE